MKKKPKDQQSVHASQTETASFGYGMFDPASRSVYVDEALSCVEEAGALLDAVLEMDRNPPAHAMPFSFRKRNPLD